MLDALVQGAEGDQPGIAGGVQRHRHLRHLGERGGEFERIGQQVVGGNREQVGARGQAGPARLDRAPRPSPAAGVRVCPKRGRLRRLSAARCVSKGGEDLLHGRVGGALECFRVDQRPRELECDGLGAVLDRGVAAPRRRGPGPRAKPPGRRRADRSSRSPSAPTVSAGAMIRGWRVASTTGTPRLASAMARCTARVRGVPRPAAAACKAWVICHK